jgi:HlyD family secretion protein
MTMNRNTMLITATAGAGLLALLAWAFAPRPTEVELAVASVGSFETSIDEDARTRLHDRYSVTVPLAGRLQRVALREGDAVAVGDVLARLTPILSPMLDQRTLREQHARVGSAEANVQRAGSRIDVAKVALERARIEFRRTTALAEQGFIAPTKVDTDRLGVQTAQKELDTALESEHMARHDLDQTRAALVAVRDAASPARGDDAFVVRAPVAGRVLKVHQTSESTVALGAPLLEIGDTTRMEIVAELLTSDALLARPDTPVRIERWGGSTVLAGTVRRVEPAAFTKVSALGVEEQRVNVLIDLKSPAAEWAALGDGFRVGVRIITRSEPNALRVPVSAVFPLPQGATGAPGGSAVFVMDAGRARLRPVTVDARNGSHAWIKDGLSQGTQVIVYPPAMVSDGARVKPRGV